ncbi:MAG TPA: type III pantothenate kinase [candidate division Zixibacteria bacterium]|nr:type III pantothenate kinase [candidate division Zixibacteria bacterium]
MLLAVDIGNTNTVAGLFEGDTIRAQVRLVSDREDPQVNLVAPLWSWYRSQLASLDEPPEVAVASVVPPLGKALRLFFENNLGVEPLFVSAAVNLPLALEFADPSQVGADRICNAVASRALYHQPGKPLVVVDFGTATTFDILNAAGDYVGGIICPGPRTAAGNLAVQAAQLFDVEIEPPSNDSVIAKNTEDAIKAGMYYGTIGEIQYLLQMIEMELGGEPTVLATGGLATVINRHSGLFETVDPDLTLTGIRLIYEYNRRN